MKEQGNHVLVGIQTINLLLSESETNKVPF